MNVVYAVLKYEPYEGSYAEKHFAKREDADYYSDWCNAIEHNRIIDVAAKYKHPENWIVYANRDVYEVEEYEVIQ